MARDELLSPTAIAELQNAVGQKLTEQRRTAASHHSSNSAEIAKIEAEITRLVDAIATVGVSDALRDRLQGAERRRAELVARPPRPAFDAPNERQVLATYRRLLLDLQGALTRDPGRARPALQQLFGDIRLVADGDEVWAKMETRAHQLLLVAGGAGVSECGCGGRI